MNRRFVVFPTAQGPCALAFGPAGVSHVGLPAHQREREDALLARFAARFGADGPAFLGHGCAAPEESPAFVAAAVASLKRHLAGDRSADLASHPVDYSGAPAFRRRVYEALRQVPAGSTVSYGELAARAGSPGGARAVGQAMAKNPTPLLVPCHRVLGAGSASGGFSGPGGLAQKRALLALEGFVLPEQLGFYAKAAAPSFDPAEALRHLRERDAVLGGLFDRVGPYELRQQKARATFDALARSIVYQQLSGKAAATILGRFVDLFPPPFPTPEAVLRARATTLAKCGLSRAKVLAIKDLAAKCVSGEVPRLARLRRMEDDAIIEALTQVRGIGRWTVEMLLMFRLGRPDVLPVDDLGVRRGYQLTFGLEAMPLPKELARIGERWKPYRSVASWYFWRAVDLERTKTKG